MEWHLLELRLNPAPSGRVRFGRDVPLGLLEPRTNLTDFDLWYYWAGKGRLRTREGWITLRPGVCVWARPGWTYETFQDKADPLGMTFLHFHLLDSVGQPVTPFQVTLPPEQLVVEDAALTNAATRYVSDVCHALRVGVPGMEKRLPSATALFRSVLLVLAEATQAMTRGRFQPLGQSVIHELLRRVREGAPASRTVAELAQASGYSRQHINRLCRTATGMSLQQYILANRIARARQLLTQPGLTIAQIAAQCGYEDPLYFSRQFREVTGASPSAFRDTRERRPA